MASRLRSLLCAYPRRSFLAVMTMAVALRWLAWQRATMMTNDGPDFLWQAQRMLAGRWADALSHHYHPLYAVLSAGGALVLGDVVAGAVLVSIVAGAVAVWAVYALARRAFPDRPGVALAAALLAAVHSASVTHTSDVRSDGLHAALFVLSVATLLAALDEGGWRWLAAGATAGLAYLTRPEALFLLAPALMAAVACGWRRGPRPASLAALGFAAGLALITSPYVVAIHELTGRWVLSMKPSIAAAGLADSAARRPLPPNCPLASPVVPSGRSDVGVLTQSDGALGRTGSDAISVGRALIDVTRSDVLFFAALGWPGLWRRRRGLALALLVVLGGWLALATLHQHASGYLNDRHMLAPAQLVLPLAGAGWLALWESRWWRPVARLICLAIVALIVVGAVKRRHPDQVARLEGLAFAKARTTAEQRVVVHRRKDGWYAGRPVIVLSLPCEDRELIDTMLREGAALLVLDEEVVRRTEPHWLDGTLFETLARFGEGDEAVVVLGLRD